MPLHGIPVSCPPQPSDIPVQCQFHTPMCHSMAFLFCALPLWVSCSTHSSSSITFLSCTPHCTPLHSPFAPLISPCLSLSPVTILSTPSAPPHTPLHPSTPSISHNTSLHTTAPPCPTAPLCVPHPSMPHSSPPHLFMPHCTPTPLCTNSYLNTSPPQSKL